MVSFKSLKKTLSKLSRIKNGLKSDDLDQIYKTQNIDLDLHDIDEDYMKEIISWRSHLRSRDSSYQSISDKRDVSVPISRRSDINFNQKEVLNKRYNSNIKNRPANYYNFKQSSKLFEMSTNNPNQGLQRSQPTHIPSFGTKKFSKDSMSEIVNLKTKKYRRPNEGYMGVQSPQSPSFPITTKKMELFPKELN
jgi:hypothetical protein